MAAEISAVLGDAVAGPCEVAVRADQHRRRQRGIGVDGVHDTGPVDDVHTCRGQQHKSRRPQQLVQPGAAAIDVGCPPADQQMIAGRARIGDSQSAETVFENSRWAGVCLGERRGRSG